MPERQKRMDRAIAAAAAAARTDRHVGYRPLGAIAVLVERRQDKCVCLDDALACHFRKYFL